MKIEIFYQENEDKNYSYIKQEYIARIEKYCDFSIINTYPVKDEKTFFILITDLGEDVSSDVLSRKIDSILTCGYSKIVFFLIQKDKRKLDNEQKIYFDYNLNLSSIKSTFDMKLIFLLEQVYRCFKINNGEIYHK
ncbi:SPOUT methyltransferase domain protein [Peptostreptococcaceae bacterium AS15]|nr:SPOUT methyltransferase domain protein [Peptostreptococcaceae bacterium AS15]